MKILFKQPDPCPRFTENGIFNCYCKELQNQDHASKKYHHHTHFELHVILAGAQTYLLNDLKYSLFPGDYLLVPPHTSHHLELSASNTLKLAITFNASIPINAPITAAANDRFTSNVDFLIEESEQNQSISSLLIQNCIFEILLSLLRPWHPSNDRQIQPPSDKLSMAKQYIEERICRAPSVSEVAKFCHISAKQLTRLFMEQIGIAPGAYIIGRKVAHCENLLQNSSFPLQKISEEMNFGSEYYFNAFIKKHLGLPPGEYRKSFQDRNKA